MLRAVLAEVRLQTRGAGEPRGQARPQHPASSFNYLKSQTARRRVCERPVSPRPPGAPTSWAASPVCPPASGWLPPRFLCFLEALYGRGFGQELEVPASAVSLLSLSLFLDQADRRADFVVVVVVFNEFKDLSFSFYILASPWNTYLCQQPQTLTSAGLVSVNGFLFSQFLFFTVLPMLPFWVRFTGSLVWN